MRSRLTAALLGLLLALPSGTPPATGPALVAGGLVVLAPTGDAQARAGRTSGGYSRPSAPSRTPSFSAPRSSPSPSGSGGYRRPSVSPPAARPTPTYHSPADRELSRRQSGEALERYRAPRPDAGGGFPAPTPTAPPPGARRHGQSDDWGGYRSPGGWGGGWGSGWGGSRGTGWGGGWGGGWAGGWRPPGYAYNSPPRFGIWDGLFLWFLLDNLTRPGYADFFHNQRGDPGYQQWREEAERRAQGDAELRAKLDQLDRQLAEKQGQPADPSYLPPGTPREVAIADARPVSDTGNAGDDAGGGFGGGFLILVLLAGGGVLVMLWLARRRMTPRAAGAAPASGPLDTAGKILRAKVSGEAYAPSLFRVGMTLTADPTPFILAGGATKVTAPDMGGGLVSVEAVGRLTAGNTTLHRLYLPGGRSFFQLHLGADGRPDECRYFSLIDEVSPASQEEWAFWLDPAEGMIGWPEFQTKDGKLYARQWAPGTARIAPHDFAETRTEGGGERARRLHAMLYAAPTGAPAPAPETEYVLVAAVEDAGQAWVEVHAGIDVNPATLSLA
ncbi:DUF2491 family protein [Azospirillum sp.]|uniref:DUF2491 family protein n=1 Tax=Azospirillum sp. TaxID=34012 RepID=UPI002D4E78A6|nr:DUF2491 family protein [Azospirillum sp.]HYD68093.1 DUF2491 family protein [Azospirillum sp.]